MIAARRAPLGTRCLVAHDDLAIGVLGHKRVRYEFSVARNLRRLNRTPVVVVFMSNRPLGRSRLLRKCVRQRSRDQSDRAQSRHVPARRLVEGFHLVVAPFQVFKKKDAATVLSLRMMKFKPYLTILFRESPL